MFRSHDKETSLLTSLSNEGYKCEDVKKVIEKRSNCRAFEGILLTKDMKDILQERSCLINFPQKYDMNENQSKLLIKTFSSEAEEKMFKQAIRVLGFGFYEADNAPMYGNLLMPWFHSALHDSNENQRYVSTIKYYSISALNVSYDISEIELSEEATECLRSVLKAYILHDQTLTVQVIQECEHFLQLFGSHITIGPLDFGSHIIWTCLSKNFDENERDSILEMQKSVLSSCDIHDTDIDVSKYKELCSTKTLDDTCLACETLSGPSKATSLVQWKAECNSKYNDWLLLDRGRKLVAVWELFKLSQHEEFVATVDILMQSWEKISGLKASNYDFSILNNRGTSQESTPTESAVEKPITSIKSYDIIIANADAPKKPTSFEYSDTVAESDKELTAFKSSDTVAKRDKSEEPTAFEYSDTVAKRDKSEEPTAFESSDTVAKRDKSEEPTAFESSDTVAKRDKAEEPTAFESSDTVAKSDKELTAFESSDTVAKRDKSEEPTAFESSDTVAKRDKLEEPTAFESSDTVAKRDKSEPTAFESSDTVAKRDKAEEPTAFESSDTVAKRDKAEEPTAFESSDTVAKSDKELTAFESSDTVAKSDKELTAFESSDTVAKRDKSEEPTAFESSDTVAKRDKSEPTAFESSDTVAKRDKSEEPTAFEPSDTVAKSDKELTAFKSSDTVAKRYKSEPTAFESSDTVAKRDKSEEPTAFESSDTVAKRDKAEEPTTFKSSDKVAKSDKELTAFKSSDTVAKSDKSEKPIPTGSSDTVAKSDKSEKPIPTGSSDTVAKSDKSEYSIPNEPSETVDKSDKELTAFEYSDTVAKRDKSEEPTAFESSDTVAKRGKAEEPTAFASSDTVAKRYKAEEPTTFESSDTVAKSDKSEKPIPTGSSDTVAKSDKSEYSIPNEPSEAVDKSDKTERNTRPIESSDTFTKRDVQEKRRLIEATSNKSAQPIIQSEFPHESDKSVTVAAKAFSLNEVPQEPAKAIVSLSDSDPTQVCNSFAQASKMNSNIVFSDVITNCGSNTLQLLGLSSYYTKKIQLKQAQLISSDTNNISFKDESSPEVSELPFLVLYKLMSYDANCRSDLMSPSKKQMIACSLPHKNESSSSESEEDEESDSLKNKINPMDCLHALLLCCGDLLRQALISRLAKCQLSVPFLMPDPVKKTLILPIWAMRSIIKEWTPHGKQQQSHSIVTYPMPIISFIRLGENKSNKFSKSRIMNSLISDLEKSPFFHYDCPGGQYPRLFSEGLVDMSWYLPSGKSYDTFDDAIAFLNLHGDARNFPLQSEILIQISSLCFVLIVNEDFKAEDQDLTILKKFHDSNGLQILNGTGKKLNELKTIFPNSSIIKLSNKNATAIKEVICKKIVKVRRNQYTSIEEFINSKHISDIEVDEKCDTIRTAIEHASIIEKHIKSCTGEPTFFKKEVVPLQGKDLWQAWSKKNKELNRQAERGNPSIEEYSYKIEQDKKMIRLKQLDGVKVPSITMKTFLDFLFQFNNKSTAQQRNIFLQCLNLALNKHMNERRNYSLKLQAELSSLSSESCEEEMKRKRDEYASVQYENSVVSFGMENLFREIGQIFEAAHDRKEHESYCSQLSNVMADLVIDGYPLELMDGDAAHVPLQWIKAVFKDVIKKIGDQKVYVLSVLGLQSSGKSTMLNAVFGLQFKVSAGRCTRGAFMQLIQVDSNIESRTGCRYILVVDTEGLRAPENDQIEKYKHDNELATFVIGLANTTLINIMGEVPGDMDDILQTSVHAFLRMIRVENQRSCQFVHQNTSLASKSRAGHTKFTKKLDQFTKDAAVAEKCGGKYDCFNDVIKYNDMKDIHFFPGLWKGDPPMAPVNEGYSEKAQFLKDHILNTICERSLDKSLHSVQELSFFIVKFTDLWEALLHEDFVFSFKNTLEILAYNSLAKEYSRWDWSFQECMIEWTQATSNEIKGNQIDNAANIIQKRKDDLPSYVHTKHDELKLKMDNFFSGKYHEILIQWKKNFEIKLELLAERLRQEASDYCTQLLKSKQEISDFERKKHATVNGIKQWVQHNIEAVRKKMLQLEESLQNKSIDESQLTSLLEKDLFASDKLESYKCIIGEESFIQIDKIKNEEGVLNECSLKHILFSILSVDQVKAILKQSPQPDAILEAEFDSKWHDIVSTISYTRPGIPARVADEVKQALYCYAQNKGCHGILIPKLRELSFHEWKTFILKPVLVKHYSKLGKDESSDDSYHKWNFWKSKSNKSPSEHAAEVMTNSIMYQAKQRMSKITQQESNFSASLVNDILQSVDKAIQYECSPERNDYNIIFTHEHLMELCLIICSQSVPLFEEMAERFEDQQDPRKYLEATEKGPLCVMYKNVYKQTEAEEAIADTICAYLEKPMTDQIKKSLGTKMISKIKNSVPHLADKTALKVKILLDLLQQDDFKETMVYVKEIQKCLMNHIDKYIIEFCDREITDSDLTQLQSTACDEMHQLVQNIVDTFKEICISTTNLHDLIRNFCENRNLHCLMEVKLTPEYLIAGYDSIEDLNLDNLKDNVIQQINHFEVRFKNKIVLLKCQDTMKDWSHQPRDLLKNLIGCTAACPFCGEQCDILDEDHLKNKQLHRTEIHRSTCLAGWRNIITQVMDTGFCPHLVASNRSFRDKEDKRHLYKQYKDVFPNWSIEPTTTVNNALYWKRFIRKYNDELALSYNAKAAHIPDHWDEFTKEGVITDLKKLYSIETL